MFSTRKPLLPRGKISISSQRLAAKAVCAQVSCPDTQTGTGDAPLFSCLSKRKGEEKRTTQEGEDFDFFPLLTPLIETMKEGHIPSFKTPLRCADLEAFILRTSLLAGAACAAPESVTQQFAHARDGALDVPPSTEKQGRQPLKACHACFRIQVIASSLSHPPRGKQVRRLPHLQKCPSLACFSQISTTLGWIKGGEKSPPLPFQLGGFQRGEEIGIFPPLACFLFLSTFSWARAKRKWTPTSLRRRVKRAADSRPYILWSAEGKTTSPAMRKKAGKSAKNCLHLPVLSAII